MITIKKPLTFTVLAKCGVLCEESNINTKRNQNTGELSLFLLYNQSNRENRLAQGHKD
jgi:hypothetical protein